MSAIELLTERAQLTLLELTDGEPAQYTIRRSVRVAAGQHADVAFYIAAGPEQDGAHATARLQEEPLEQVGRADHPPMAEREAQVGDAASKSSRKQCTTAGSSRS